MVAGFQLLSNQLPAFYNNVGWSGRFWKHGGWSTSWKPVNLGLSKMGFSSKYSIRFIKGDSLCETFIFVYFIFTNGTELNQAERERKRELLGNKLGIRFFYLLFIYFFAAVPHSVPDLNSFIFRYSFALFSLWWQTKTLTAVFRWRKMNARWIWLS